MNVLVSSDAEQDIMEGIAFYSTNGSHVGKYFYRSILVDLQSLALFGGVHSQRFGYQCMAAKRFPFAIYYKVSNQDVHVVAILDERRDPAWVAGRLNG
jgi:plasmid stabilization system protein ParE